jgi:preprotein translocase subunit SecB
MSSNANSTTTPFFSMQKIFLKTSSFESPNTVSIFAQDWKPETTLDLNVTHRCVDEGRYEVVLSVAITARNADQLAFVLEVDQAALFLIDGFTAERRLEALGAACPAIMFPYLRETVDHLLLKGGYPPLMLAPVNFDALYADRQRESA